MTLPHRHCRGAERSGAIRFVQEIRQQPAEPQLHRECRSWCLRCCSFCCRPWRRARRNIRPSPSAWSCPILPAAAPISSAAPLRSISRESWASPSWCSTSRAQAACSAPRRSPSANPDGYTLGIFSTGFLTAQYTVPTPTSAADYELVALVNVDPAVIAVPQARDWKTLPELLQYARANPGKLRVGIDPGSSAQIFAAAFVEKAGLHVIYVPFRGGGERTVALAGGHIDVDFDIIAPLKTMRQAGKVRVLAVASRERVPDYPEIPTMAEEGVDLTVSSWHGIFAPRGTPAAVISQLSSALRRVTDNPEFRERMHDLQLGVQYLDTAQFREFFAESDSLNLALIRKLGLLVTPAGSPKQP